MTHSRLVGPIVTIVTLGVAACGTSPAGPSPTQAAPPGLTVPSGPSTAVLEIEAFDAGPRDADGNFLAFDPQLTLRETGGQSAAFISAIVFTVGTTNEWVTAAGGCIQDPVVPAGGTWDSMKITYYCLDGPEAQPAAPVSVLVDFTDADGRPGEVTAQLAG